MINKILLSLLIFFTLLHQAGADGHGEYNKYRKIILHDKVSINGFPGNADTENISGLGDSISFCNVVRSLVDIDYDENVYSNPCLTLDEAQQHHNSDEKVHIYLKPLVDVLFEKLGGQLQFSTDDVPKEFTTDTYLQNSHLVAIVNRFDLMDGDLEQCGQYRLIFGTGGLDNGLTMSTIVEATLSNPYDKYGNNVTDTDACKKVLSYWNDMPELPSSNFEEEFDQNKEKLENIVNYMVDFFFKNNEKNQLKYKILDLKNMLLESQFRVSAHLNHEMHFFEFAMKADSSDKLVQRSLKNVLNKQTSDARVTDIFGDKVNARLDELFSYEKSRLNEEGERNPEPEEVKTDELFSEIIYDLPRSISPDYQTGDGSMPDFYSGLFEVQDMDGWRSTNNLPEIHRQYAANRVWLNTCMGCHYNKFGNVTEISEGIAWPPKDTTGRIILGNGALNVLMKDFFLPYRYKLFTSCADSLDDCFENAGDDTLNPKLGSAYNTVDSLIEEYNNDQLESVKPTAEEFNKRIDGIRIEQEIKSGLFYKLKRPVH